MNPKWIVWPAVGTSFALVLIGGWWMMKQSNISKTTIETPSSQSSAPSFAIYMAVTDNDNGSTVTLAVGEAMAIRLETLMGAGYQWSLDSYDKNILNLVSDQILEPTQNSDRKQEIVGAPSLEQWMFTALKSGTTKIELTNFRPFEPKPTTPTFTVTVVVK